MGRTKNFADVIRAEMAADPALAEAMENESFNSDIAMKVYDLRKEAGLTQKELADRIGTRQSVISRLEDADYGGHSLAVLKRIAHCAWAKTSGSSSTPAPPRPAPSPFEHPECPRRATTWPERYLAQLPYTPYPVQENALLAWFTAEQGVLVCAPPAPARPSSPRPPCSRRCTPAPSPTTPRRSSP